MGMRRKFDNEDFHDSYSLPNAVMKRMGRIAQKWENKIQNKFISEKQKRKGKLIDSGTHVRIVLE